VDVYGSLEEARARGALRGCAVAIGNFDGVHLGHQRLVEVARAQARAHGAPAVALTFEPHPVRVLRPELAPPLLTELSRKLELLAEHGMDAVVVQSFDRAYAQTSAEEFVSRDLAGLLAADDVVVGWDFTAGRGRTRVDALRGMMLSRGIALHVVQPVTSDGLTVSSTKIREFLLEGKVDAAAALLTRPHAVQGVVERGAGRGRGFGFATANLEAGAMFPAAGVYAVRVLLGGELRGELPGATAEPHRFRLEGAVPYGGVCNVGVKPTVESASPVLAETHLFDFDGRDLYGERIRVSFLQRLRDERRFPSIDALRAQIAQDAARARDLLRQASM
jgi:riboflavin kinase/FMN adenylyltransferase